MPRRHDAWRAYVAAMRAHLAAEERARERLSFYVGSPSREPLTLLPQDWDDWQSLLAEVEQAVAAHRSALERYRRAT